MLTTHLPHGLHQHPLLKHQPAFVVGNIAPQVLLQISVFVVVDADESGARD